MLWLAYQIISGLIMFCIGTCGVAYLIHHDQKGYRPTGKIGLTVLVSISMTVVIFLSILAYAVLPFILIMPLLAAPPFIVYRIATKFSFKSFVTKMLRSISE